jgi:hypothetical protein
VPITAATHEIEINLLLDDLRVPLRGTSKGFLTPLAPFW